MFTGSSPDRRSACGSSAGTRGACAVTAFPMALDVVGRGAAAAADEVHQPARGELAEDLGSLLGRLVVLPEGVGQPGVRVAGHEAVGDPGELGEVGPHLRGAQRAVEPDGERPGVPHGVPERLGDLAGQRAAGGVGDRAGDDDRPAAAALLEERLEREDRRLRVEGVEDRLDDQQVGAAVDEAAGLLVVGLDELARRRCCGRPGSLTSGEIDAVELVGPRAPATYRGRSGVCSVIASPRGGPAWRPRRSSRRRGPPGRSRPGRSAAR